MVSVGNTAMEAAGDEGNAAYDEFGFAYALTEPAQIHHHTPR